jgi:hypothetical protein
MSQAMNAATMCRTSLLLIVLAGCLASVVGQQSQPVCTCVKEPEASRGKAVIFGEPVEVPALSFRFVRQETGEPLQPGSVRIFYSWRWIEYPYQEHPWGVWSSESEVFECQASGSRLEAPSRTVRPRGWYAGKYTKWPWVWSSGKPRFEEVGINFEMNETRLGSFSIQRDELKRMARGTCTVLVPRKGPPEVALPR